MKGKPVFLILSAFAVGGLLGYSGFFYPSAPEMTGNPDQKTSGSHRARNLQIYREAEDKMLSMPSVNNLDGLLQRYASLTPSEIRDELLRLCHSSGKESPYHKEIALKYLAFKLGQQAPGEVKKILESKEIDNRDELFPSFLCGWAENDLEGAMSYLQEHKRSYSSSRVLFGNLVDIMAEKDPARVMQWSGTLPAGERRFALRSLSESLPRSHPESMTAFAALLTPDDLKDYMITFPLGKSWAAADWGEYAAWVGTLGKEDQKYFLASGFEGLSKANREKATEEYHKYSGEDKSAISKAIVTGMSKQEKTSGLFLDWLHENVTDRQEAYALLDSVLTTFEYQTPELTGHLLDMPQGMTRDAVLTKLATSKLSLANDKSSYMDAHLKHSTPTYSEALELASHISDQSQRDGMTKSCLRTWLEKSPKDTRQWLEKHNPLSPEDK